MHCFVDGRKRKNSKGTSLARPKDEWGALFPVREALFDPPPNVRPIGELNGAVGNFPDPAFDLVDPRPLRAFVGRSIQTGDDVSRKASALLGRKIQCVFEQLFPCHDLIIAWMGIEIQSCPDRLGDIRDRMNRHFRGV